MQDKFDAYKLLCHYKSARRKEENKVAFEQKNLYFAFKRRHLFALKVHKEVSWIYKPLHAPFK